LQIKLSVLQCCLAGDYRNDVVSVYRTHAFLKKPGLHGRKREQRGRYD